MRESVKAKADAAKKAAGGQQENQPNRASQSGARAANSSQSTVEMMGEKLGDNMTDQVVFIAMQRVASNLKDGKFSDRVDSYINSFMKGFDDSLEQKYLEIDEEIDPKYALPSSETLNNSQGNLPNSLSKATAAMVTLDAEISD